MSLNIEDKLCWKVLGSPLVCLAVDLKNIPSLKMHRKSLFYLCVCDALLFNCPLTKHTVTLLVVLDSMRWSTSGD